MGRTVRQRPVWLTRLLLGSRVMAKGLRSMFISLSKQAVSFNIAISNGLNGRDGLPIVRLTEQMFKAPLQLQITLHRYLPANEGAVSDLAKLCLKQREESRLHRKPCDLNCQRRIVRPADGAGDMNVN